MAVIKTNPEKTQTIEGAEHDATISLILDRSNPGQGPKLHRHPYDETWLVVDGSVNFQAGDKTKMAGPGDVVIVPANTPHKFTNCGVSEFVIERPTFSTQRCGLWEGRVVAGVRASSVPIPLAIHGQRATPSKAPLIPRGSRA